MIIPVRCFTCGTVVASAHERFTKKRDELIAGGLDEVEASQQAMGESGLRRFCCRRMILTHVDLVSEAAPYQ